MNKKIKKQRNTKSTEKRSERINICLTKEEKDKIKLKAEKSGMELSDYCRRAFFRVKLVVPPTSDYTEMCHLMRNYCSSINDLKTMFISSKVLDTQLLQSELDKLIQFNKKLESEYAKRGN